MKMTIVKHKPEYQNRDCKPEYQNRDCNDEGLGRVFEGDIGQFYIVIQQGDRHSWAILKRSNYYIGMGRLKIHPVDTLDHVRPYGLLIFDWGE